jgi:hypothetical protein
MPLRRIAVDACLPFVCDVDTIALSGWWGCLTMNGTGKRLI